MARSFSNVKILSALVVDAVKVRGYAAAASQGVVSRGGSGASARSPAMLKKDKEMVGSTDKVSWAPDPVTGFYRPDNGSQEIDAAELRAMLLKKH